MSLRNEMDFEVEKLIKELDSTKQATYEEVKTGVGNVFRRYLVTQITACGAPILAAGLGLLGWKLNLAYSEIIALTSLSMPISVGIYAYGKVKFSQRIKMIRRTAENCRAERAGRELPYDPLKYNLDNLVRSVW